MQSSQQTGLSLARGRALVVGVVQVFALLAVPVLAVGYLAGGVFTTRALGDPAVAVSPLTFDAPSETVRKDRTERRSWLEMRDYRVVDVATADIEGRLAEVLDQIERALADPPR